MLSYQHLHHAGNFADVIKHVTLAAWLQHCTGQILPVHYLDTHAGAGRYNLQQRRSREYDSGAGRLDLDTAPTAIAAYLHRVRAEAPWYPGSLAWASTLLRKQDHLRCYEQHPGTYRQLQQYLGQDKRIRIVQGDGLHALATLTAPKQGLGLALIDPPYECHTEYAATLHALSLAQARWPRCGYLLWYPLVRDLPRTFPGQLRPRIPGAVQVEFTLYPRNLPIGLNGCGLLLVNAPNSVLAALPDWLTWLSAQWTSPQTHPQWQITPWSDHANPDLARRG